MLPTNQQLPQKRPDFPCSRNGLGDARDAEEKQALRLLEGTPHGYTKKTLRAHRFRDGLLSRIVRAGFATANLETVKAGTLSLVRLTITDAGRRALAGT
jgi:hypothetical protein